jgi:hypothetical protein
VGHRPVQVANNTPRFAHLGDQRFWRAGLPDGTISA